MLHHRKLSEEVARMAHALLDRLTRGRTREVSDAEREAFDREAEARYARLMGDHLSREELQRLHREASEAAPVRCVTVRR